MNTINQELKGSEIDRRTLWDGLSLFRRAGGKSFHAVMNAACSITVEGERPIVAPHRSSGINILRAGDVRKRQILRDIGLRAVLQNVRDHARDLLCARSGLIFNEVTLVEDQGQSYIRLYPSDATTTILEAERQSVLRIIEGLAPSPGPLEWATGWNASLLLGEVQPGTDESHLGAIEQKIYEIDEADVSVDLSAPHCSWPRQ